MVADVINDKKFNQVLPYSAKKKSVKVSNFFAGDGSLGRRKLKANKNIDQRKLRVICETYLKGK